MSVVENVPTAICGDKFRHAVEEMIREREQVLVTFCALLSMDADDAEPYREELARLAQLLTDYSALAHFEVIDPFISSKGVQAADDVKTIAAIQDTTDDILKFTDLFSETDDQAHSMMEFGQALNVLGERLAERFELEDRLLGRVPA